IPSKPSKTGPDARQIIATQFSPENQTTKSDMPITAKYHRERSTKTKPSIYAKPQHSTRSNLPLQTPTQMPGPSNSLTPRIRETLDLGRILLNPLPSSARFPNASRMSPPAATSPRKTPEKSQQPNSSHELLHGTVAGT
ncbi:hypothetical protein KC19_1G091600, partial [Ceratodon purpureus]